MSDIGYIIGVLLGDGYLSEKSNYEIGLMVVNESFAHKFADALSIISKNKVMLYERNKRRIWVQEKKTYDFTTHYFVVRLNDKDIFLLLQELLNNWEVSLMADIDVLNGFLDSEGCVYSNHSGIYKYTRIEMYNKNVELLKKMQSILIKNGISSKLYSRLKIGYWKLSIQKQDDVKNFQQIFSSFKF